MQEKISFSEALAVVALAAIAFLIFGYKLRSAVRLAIKKGSKRRRVIGEEGPRWVGPGYSRKQRRD